MAAMAELWQAMLDHAKTEFPEIWTDVARVAVIVSHGSWGGLQHLPHPRENGNCSV